MIKSLYQAGRSMDGRMKSMEVIANNLANLNSTGFKREVPFSEVLSQVNEVRMKAVTDFQQGVATETKNPLDFTINGKGFFVLEGEYGMSLTRNGKFTISNDGFLVNDSGRRVMGRNGAINLLETTMGENSEISISRKGELKVGEIVVDTLLIGKVDASKNYQRIDGTNFFLPDEEFELSHTEDYELLQGYLEDSNINPITEMENMISISKEYESAQKMVTFLDDSLGKANEVGKV
jgi:flagellar basal-body rod protein FlgF